MSRIVARETCFKLIFEFEFLKKDNESTLTALLGENNLTEEDAEFVINSYKGILEHNEEILGIIKKYVKGYSIDRLYKVDLAILKVAVYEIMFDKSLPVSVIINEAVELAKKYSTDKSFSFINGVLATVVEAEK